MIKIIIILLSIGLLFIMINLNIYKQNCVSKTIIYRYIPKSFNELQDNPVYVSDIFKNMFGYKIPNIYSVGDIEISKK